MALLLTPSLWKVCGLASNITTHQVYFVAFIFVLVILRANAPSVRNTTNGNQTPFQSNTIERKQSPHHDGNHPIWPHNNPSCIVTPSSHVSDRGKRLSTNLDLNMDYTAKLGQEKPAEKNIHDKWAELGHLNRNEADSFGLQTHATSKNSRPNKGIVICEPNINNDITHYPIIQKIEKGKQDKGKNVMIFNDREEFGQNPNPIEQINISSTSLGGFKRS
ncbi:hypothetical protein FRX31_020371 [Thalictrum thalictroides]|uniref:Uncharacterized protein n=1 Tax=Thalictrum thalictroides TaxID=46969 RepID=A0A7J6VYV1_THATH|nr:hypothetical protein FRX31_020371 [Thalictrum thalictroides]